MKIIWRILLPAALIGFFLTGLFAGGSQEAKPSPVATSPAWVSQTPSDADGKSFFVAMGNDPTGNEGAAQDAAGLDLINQINRYLGVSITAESTGTEVATANDYQASVIGVVRQSGGGEVAGLRIADRHVRKDKQGTTVYLLGEYRTADLEREKAKRQAIEAENEAAIAVPETRGREAEARGEVFTAMTGYLQAARAAMDRSVRNGEAKLERNVQSALRVLGRLVLEKVSAPEKVLAKAAFDQDFVVAVKDGDTGQALAGVDLLAYYREYQANGKYSWVKRNIKSDASGLARIRLPDAVVVGSEQLTLSLNLADALQALGTVEGKNRDLVSGLFNQVAARKAVFDFAVLSAGRGIPLAVVVREADENGKATEGNAVALGIQQKLTAAGFRIVALAGNPGDWTGKSDADIQAMLRQEAGVQAERIAYGLATVLSLDDRGADGVFAKVNATISVFEVKTGTVLSTITQLVNGRGANPVQAKKDALTRLGQEMGNRMARDLP